MATARGKISKRKPATEPDDNVQSNLFIEEAKALEAEEGVKAFARALEKLLRERSKKPGT